MKPIYIFRHIGCEGPGYLGKFLTERGAPYRIVAIDQGEPVPPDIKVMSGMVFMGGPMSVNDPLPWIADELALIRQAQQSDLPVLGHCLGGQLIAKALGAEIHANPVKEIGWHHVSQVGSASLWTKELPQSFEAYHWHGETFELPADAEHLLQSKWCRNQAFSYGNMLALQFHVEMTAIMVEEWAHLYHQQLDPTSPSVQSLDDMLVDLTNRSIDLNGIADKFYDRWLNLVTG